MKRVFNPAVIVALGLSFGLAVGLFFYWRAAERILIAAAETRTEKGAVQPEKGWDFWTIEIDNLTSELKGEREKIRAEYAQLEQRSSQLASERQELEKLRTGLEQMRQDISNRLTEIGTDEQKNLRTLAQTYSAMLPKSSVAIMREMDDSSVVKILFLMKPDVVSQIFDEMARTADTSGSLAKRAATLSERLRLMKSTKASAL